MYKILGKDVKTSLPNIVLLDCFAHILQGVDSMVSSSLLLVLIHLCSGCLFIADVPQKYPQPKNGQRQISGDEQERRKQLFR